MSETYTCANCEGTFEKGRRDEEADAEARKLFGDLYDPDNREVLCDDCFVHFMAWLKGYDIPPASPEQATGADLAICARKADAPEFFGDNLEGVCSMCGEVIVFRPHMPKEPPKICTRCVPAWIEADNREAGNA